MAPNCAPNAVTGLASVVEFDPERYRAFGRAALLHTPIANAVREDGKVHFWLTLRAGLWRKRNAGPACGGAAKCSPWRDLAKAAFTYAGGIDYLAWKINRHAGTKIEIKPWQRRWPLVAALVLVPRLLVKGAVK